MPDFIVATIYLLTLLFQGLIIVATVYLSIAGVALLAYDVLVALGRGSEAGHE
jgi:hypothetical protein